MLRAIYLRRRFSLNGRALNGRGSPLRVVTRAELAVFGYGSSIQLLLLNFRDCPNLANSGFGKDHGVADFQTLQWETVADLVCVNKVLSGGGADSPALLMFKGDLAAGLIDLDNLARGLILLSQSPRTDDGDGRSTG